MKNLLIFLFTSIVTMTAIAQTGYKIGDIAEDFTLKSTNETMVSLVDYKDAKGFIVIFTCNHCPYVKAYDERINAIHNKYGKLGYPVVGINPNDPEVQPGDSFEKMKEKVKEQNISYAYLIDEKQEVYPKYGATRTPHVFVLQKAGKDLIVKYIGTIDNNYADATNVDKKYLEDALDALLAGEEPDPDFTKAIGCTIKKK